MTVITRLYFLFIILALIACSNDATLTGSLASSINSLGGTVATPQFSTTSGAVAPGTTVSGSDATTGATIYYTWSTNGSAPANPSYDSSTYMPAWGSQSFILGTAGTSGITAGHAFMPAFTIYGPIQIKMMAAKSGMTDSAIASASYTLTAPTGTPISSCQTITGTNYLTADVTSTGTCFPIGAANTTLNLNGHTITYGTGTSTVLSGTGTATNGSTTFTCSGCTFTAAMNGDRIFADNYNTGGYQNTADNTTITYVNSTTVTLNNSATFSSTSTEFFITTAPTYGIDCDPSVYATCTAAQVYNGTITQGSTAAPGSNAIEVNPHSWGGANGPFVWANLTINISQVEAEALYEQGSAGADLIANNTINDSVTSIYYRDGIPYPLKLDNDSAEVATTPIKTVENNVILGSPQGGIYDGFTANVLNNFTNSGPTQYANSFCYYAAGSGSVFRGNTCLGNTQGMEEEGSANIYQNNYNSSQSSASVHDPNHNPIGCNLNYGIRFKDFDFSGNGSTASMFNNVVDSNVFNDIAGVCGASDIEFSIMLSGDTASVTNNIVTMSFPVPPPATLGNESALLSSDSGETGQSMAGVTYNNNTLSRTGTYAASGYDVLVLYDGAVGWTIPQLVNPLIYFWNGVDPTSMTLTGTGTPTCSATNSSGNSILTATWNGAPVNCPGPP